jgi:hypothetical protein
MRVEKHATTSSCHHKNGEHGSPAEDKPDRKKRKKHYKNASATPRKAGNALYSFSL